MFKPGRQCIVTMMMPFSMRCNTCGHYANIGTKFNIEINESYSTSTSNDNVQQTEEGFPVQHSGESVGRCTRIEFVTASSNNKCSSSSYSSLPPPIRFVTLMSPRLVTE